MKRLAALVVAFALVACGDDPPDHGEVVARTIEPAHYDYWTQQVCVAYDMKYGNCVVWVPVQQKDYVPTRWKLLLRNCDKGPEKCEQGWRRVIESDYMEHPVGSEWP